MHAVTDLNATNLVVWPKWCYANSLKDDKSHDFVLNNIMNMNNLNDNNRLQHEDKDNVLLSSSPHISKKSRRKASTNGPTKGPTYGLPNGLSGDAKGHTKTERVSPDPTTESATTHVSPSPSASPKSPASHRTRTPSFSGTPPHPAFTPPTTTLHLPYDRFSPAALGAVSGLPGGAGAVKQMESLVARNCSDLMRSLAAKYNHSNPNDYFSSHRNTDFLRTSLPTLGHFKGVSYPPLGESSALISSTTNSPHQEKKSNIPVSTVPAILPQGIPPRGAPPLFPGSGIPGFPGFPLVDVSSTQVLLNMVRNASAAQPPQFENYIRGTVKRPADAPSSPLDLSSSVGTKRPRTDLGRSFDVKNLFLEEEKKVEDKAGSSPPSTSPTGAKPPSTPSPGANLSSGRVSTGIPCGDRDCPSMEGVLHWTVEDVFDFVRGIDLCAEYAEAFREHRIDGSSLPLLTEDHLTTSIHMKLGPALKLRSVLARRLGSCGVCLHCAHCHSPPNAGERHPTSASSGR